MTSRRFTWRVSAVTPDAPSASAFALLCVSADEVEITSIGVLVFWAHEAGGRAYPILAFRAGLWRSLVIQGAIDGHQNGYDVLRVPASTSGIKRGQRGA